jgi:subtilisin family serine protease
MKELKRILWTIPLLFIAGAALAQNPATLKQRNVRPKPARTILNPAKARADVIIVKFREGTHVRERAGQLEADLSNLSDVEERLLQRGNVSRQRLFQDLAQVNTAVGPNLKRFVTRLFTRSEADLNADKQAGETNIGEELADLNLYFRILIADAKPDETQRLIDQLNALDAVEIAYAQPISQEPQVDIAPTTPSFAGSQGYFSPAATGTSTTNGIDATYAHFFGGARGSDVQIIDVERGWNLTHEDLPGAFFQAGFNSSGSRQHGTAVLGVMAAGENGFGMTGISPQARIGVSSVLNQTCFLGICWTTDDFEDAVNRATAALRIGDIMLIEQHAPGPDSGLTATCNPTQFEFVAMEFFDANFDAIKNATAKGVIVVEAAGNGSMDLDSSIYSGKFNRSVRDSGAIVVGAGSSAGRAPLCFTNFGSRVDLQGWGENVATLGRGDVRVNGSDDNQWYTLTFNGTSSATPIVAGAAASLQGYRKAHGLVPFVSVAMRDFLRQTGVAQAASTRQIGPLPNLRAAIDAHAPKRTLKVTFLNIKVVDNLFAGPHALTFNFTVNNQVAQFSGSFPQSVLVNLPSGFSLTGQEILDGGLVVQVRTNLRPIITFNPKTGEITSIQSRPVQVLHFFPTGTNFNSSIFAFGSKTFTDRSSDAYGFFEVTYKVEVVNQLVIAP